MSPNFTITVKAVIFDMDGVITNTMPDHFHAWKTVLRDEGLHVTHHDIYSREGQQGLQSLQEIGKVYDRFFSHQHALRILNAKEEFFKSIARTRFIPGARSVIRRLHRQGFRLAIVTGTSRHELHRILPNDLFELFHFTVTGNEVANGKPHPEPYLTALKLLKIPAHEAIVVENAPLGIRSAKAAGLRSLALETSLPREYLREAYRVFQDWNELCEQVKFSLLK